MGQVRAEAGAPDDRVGLRARSIGPGDTLFGETAEHGRGGEEAGVAGRAYGRDGDDVAERGDTTGVRAVGVQGLAAGGRGVEERAAIDLVGQVARRTLGDPGQIGRTREVGGDLRAALDGKLVSLLVVGEVRHQCCASG